MNESLLAYECAMSHIWMSHATQIDESWHTCEWIMSHISMSHVARMNGWLVHTCDMTHRYAWQDCSRYNIRPVTWLINVTHMCGMTHWYLWHDSFICVTWLIHMCDMTHQCHTYICTRDMTLTHTYAWHICMRDMTLTHTYTGHTCMCDIGESCYWPDVVPLTARTALMRTDELCHGGYEDHMSVYMYTNQYTSHRAVCIRDSKSCAH